MITSNIRFGQSGKNEVYKVSLPELAEACRGISRNSTGGVVRQFGNEYVVRGIGRSSDIDELGNTYVKSVNGKPVGVRCVELQSVPQKWAMHLAAATRYYYLHIQTT